MRTAWDSLTSSVHRAAMTAEQAGEAPRPPRSRKPKASKPAAAAPRAKVRDMRKKRTKKSAAPVARGRGRPPKLPTEDQLRLVQAYTTLGLTQEQMAAKLGINMDTWRKYRADYFGPAMAKGDADAAILSGNALVKGIREGNMTSVIWFEKTRLGKTEKVHTVHADPLGNALPASGAMVTVGIFLPPNGRDVPAEGREIPAQFQMVQLPNNGRES